MKENKLKYNTEFEISAKQPQVDFHFTATVEAAALVRRQLRRLFSNWCPDCGVAVEELLLATGEAVSNAWRHGCGSKSLPIRLTTSWNTETREVTVEVYDPGSGFDYSAPLCRPEFDENLSCGLFLMYNSADSVSYERRDNCFVCTIKKRL